MQLETEEKLPFSQLNVFMLLSKKLQCSFVSFVNLRSQFKYFVNIIKQHELDSICTHNEITTTKKCWKVSQIMLLFTNL